MLEKYPTYDSGLIDESISSNVELLFSIIKDVRSYKIENKLAPNTQLDLILKLKTDLFEGFETYLKRFTFAKNIEFTSSNFEKKGQIHIYDLGELLIVNDFDLEEIISKLEKEIKVEMAEIDRAEKMLSNPNFVNKAPKQKVDLEKEKLELHKNNLKTLQDKLKEIN